VNRVLDPSLTTTRVITRVAAGIVAEAASISTATLHEAAGRTGDLPPTIKPGCTGFRLAGPAVTVACPNGDNLWIHRAIYAALPGDILVVQPGDGAEFGYWGEVMSTAAQARGLGGLVIAGGVRDAALLRELGFPVFSCGLCIRGTIKDPGARGWINAPVLIGEAIIAPGDLIVGDEDGVVAIPRESARQVVTAAKARDIKEAAMCEQLRAGQSTLALLGLV
jgi:4-hydroxy-4-methyl-2-oxoglutarate aldolase